MGIQQEEAFLLRQVGQGNHLCSSSPPNGGATHKEKGNVRAQLTRKFDEFFLTDLTVPQLIQSQQGQGRVAGASPQARSDRDLLLQFNPDACLRPGGFPQQISSLVENIVFSGSYLSPLDFKLNFPVRCRFKDKLLTQVNGLIDGPDLLIAVTALTQNSESPIDFGEGVPGQSVLSELSLVLRSRQVRRSVGSRFELDRTVSV